MAPVQISTMVEPTACLEIQIIQLMNETKTMSAISSQKQ